MSNNQNPTNLKTKKIGANNVVLPPVPASVARRIQISLGALIIAPLADAFGKSGGMAGLKQMKAPKKEDDKQDDEAQAAKIAAGIKAVSEILTKLDNGDFDRMLSTISPYILINGDPLDEDKHFSSSTLMHEYETIWYFFDETFGDFIAAALSRFPQLTTAAA